MRTVVFDRSLFENDVKPDGLIREYRQLLDAEVRENLLRQCAIDVTTCPGCQNESSDPAFEKSGMTYRLCGECQSLYISPRPNENTVIQFYRHSEAASFWRERILAQTRKTRLIQLIRPRAQWLLDTIDEHCPDAKMGVSAGYHCDLLIQELYRLDRDLMPFAIVNPVADIEFADLALDNVTLHPEDLIRFQSDQKADVILAFDYFDRCVDLDAAFQSIKEMLNPGGLLIANATLISGFDLQVLWERSDTIYPPERMNLLTTEGMQNLYSRHGFHALEFSTPGTFDVNIVKNAIKNEPERSWPRFIRYLVENRSDDAMYELQEYLQKNRLSSFGRIVLKKG